MSQLAKEGELGIYMGHAVGVKEVADGKAHIVYCERRYDDNGDMIREEERTEVVPADKVLKLTKALGSKLIGMYNSRIHAVRDCLQYID